MPVVVPDIAERCVVLNGVAKTYAMTGWRVGWMIGPGDVIAAATNLQSHATSNVANVSQRAALAAVSGDLGAVAEMRTAFDRRGRKMHELLAAIPGVTNLEPQGAFYCFPSFEGVLGRPIGGRTPESSLALADVVLSEAKVAFVPGEAFGAPGYGGPCPPVGRHRYFFKLYALDTVLTGLKNPKKADLQQAMQTHIVDSTQLIGTYQKTKK
jgi:aspartate/methionine/tyrosine aminotransferase